MDISVFPKSIVEWAKNEPGLIAIALVGSYARGEGKLNSDVDLLLLLDQPVEFLEERSWIFRFGEPLRIHEEDWGKVTSLRVFYAHGSEVEYGLADPGWGSDPDDEGDARVVNDGIQILFEKDNHLTNKIATFHHLARLKTIQALANHSLEPWKNTRNFVRPEIQPDLPRVGVRSRVKAGCSAQNRWAALTRIVGVNPHNIEREYPP